MNEELEQLGNEPDLDLNKDIESLPKPERKTREQDLGYHPDLNA